MKSNTSHTFRHCSDSLLLMLARWNACAALTDTVQVATCPHISGVYHAQNESSLARKRTAVARAQEGPNWHVHGSRRDRAGKITVLGSFSTAAKAALCYAQQCAAKKAEAAKASLWPLWSLTVHQSETLQHAPRGCPATVCTIPHLTPPPPPLLPFACVTAYRSLQRPVAVARPLWFAHTAILGFDGASTA